MSPDVRQKDPLIHLLSIAPAGVVSGHDLVFGANKVYGKVEGALNIHGVRHARRPSLEEGVRRACATRSEVFRGYQNAPFDSSQQALPLA